MNERPGGSSFRLRRPGGEIDTKRVFNVPGVVMALVLASIVFYLFAAFLPGRAIRIVEIYASVQPARFMAGPQANGGLLRMLAPLVTHMFVHATIAHIAFNMLWLLALGAPVARRMGAENALQSVAAFSSAALFFGFYALCGVVGALLFVVMHPNDLSLLVGASGGVSGLLGAVVRFAFNRTTLFGPEAAKFSPLLSTPVFAWSTIIIGMNLGVAIFGGALAGGASIAWEAHIGGYLAGLLLYPWFERIAR